MLGRIFLILIGKKDRHFGEATRTPLGDDVPPMHYVYIIEKQI